jgi:hypothetical protein
MCIHFYEITRRSKHLWFLSYFVTKVLYVSVGNECGNYCLSKELRGSLEHIFVTVVKYIYFFTGRVCKNTCVYSKCDLNDAIITNSGSRPEGSTPLICHRTWSWAISFHLSSSQQISLSSVELVCSHLLLYLSSGRFPRSFFTKTLY